MINNTSLWWLQVKGVPKVLYSLRMHWVGCFYWNKQHKDWFSDGCELTDQNSDTIVSCRYTRVVIPWTTCVVNTFYPTLYIRSLRAGSYYPSFSYKGALASTTATAAKTSVLKWIPVFSIQANFPGVDFLRNSLKFRERKRDSSSLVYVLHKTCN